MRVTVRLVLYKILLLCLLPLSIQAQIFPDRNVHVLVVFGIQKIMNQEYESAQTIFRKLNDASPELPLAEIYLAAVEISRANDFKEKPNEHYIDSLFECSKKKIDHLLTREPDYVWYNYFAGLSSGYKTYFHAMNGELLLALTEGLNALKYFDKCILIDSTFYEAEIAIGTYVYWKSAFIQPLQWLPFINNEKDKGISLIENAIENSSYNKLLAMYSLIWIYIDSERYPDAVRIARDALKLYPNSRFIMWGLAHAQHFLNEADAIGTYKQLLKSYKKESLNHRTNEVIVYHKIAMLYFNLNDLDESLKFCNEILEMKEFSDHETRQIGERLNRVRELRAEILKLKSSN